MATQIFVPEMTRKMHIKQLNEFGFPYFNKLINQFQDIEAEANQFEKEYLDRFLSSCDPASNIDLIAIAEQAHEKAINHYMMLRLGLYTVHTSWHSTLYEFFEQQLRLFLYHEIKSYEEVEIRSFCTDMDAIQKHFLKHNTDITILDCWPKVYELRLLCNSIKHSDGGSLNKLKQINSDIFLRQDDFDLFELYKTTLLECTLKIDERTFEDYLNSLIGFWNTIPERNYSS